MNEMTSDKSASSLSNSNREGSKEEKNTSEIIREEAQKAGLKSSISSWSGPLPPQVIDKISPEVADEMVRSLCRRQERQDHIVEKLIDAKKQDNLENKNFYFKCLASGFVFIVLLVSICLYFKNTEVLDKIFNIVGYVIGGGGLSFFIIKRGASKNPSTRLEIED